MKLLLAALVFLALLLPAAAQDEGQLRVSISGPNALAPNGRAVYNVTVTGGSPSVRDTYTIRAYLAGSYLVGASPTSSSATNQSSPRNTFAVNVTAPSGESSLELVVAAEAKNKTTSERAAKTERFKIEVLSPVVLTVSVTNPTDLAISNATADFYVDGVKVGSSVVPTIPAYGSASTNFSWLPAGLAPGEHRIEVRVDLNGDGRIDPGRGELITSSLFYKKGEELNPALIGLILILAVPGALVVYLVIRRRRRAK